MTHTLPFITRPLFHTENKCLLATHTTLTSLVLGTQLVIVGLYFGAPNAFGRTTSKFLMNGIWHYGRGDAANDMMIDDMQQMLTCCTVYNINEWSMSANGSFPASCCPFYKGRNTVVCDDYMRYDEPCATAWNRLTRRYTTEIAATGITLLVLQALAILVSIILTVSVKSGKKYKVHH